MRVRTRTFVAAGVVVALFAIVGGWGVRQFDGELRLPIAGRSCTVQADGTVKLDADQMANAATIAAIGMQRQMPEQAVVVALATAYQESGLRNLTHGDRDSLGLFQQRPSQGWGTPEQIRDQRYAATRFYKALKKVRGWERMEVTDAAQAVQRSAYPTAYQKWADESQVLARALLGEATGAVACTVGRTPVMRGQAAAAELTRGLTLDWGLPDAGAVAELTDVTVPATDVRDGWRYAHWLVSHAPDHGVKRVRFDGLEWSADNGRWAKVSDGRPTEARVLAEVFADRA
ncbi:MULTISPECIES: hypothetical protein [Micromonospora]|uniref:Heavy metal transporter n=1 Tax=Micromonospora antibiotica TaxID=2807623 RepID=A0ABS3VG54_9ACTN|nr:MULTISPECIES: hypothetical protein [Micromonospora]MBO4164583.1 hypothetical protein [Micromonospora antibiotica]MBW4702713.1 hypothetical protein [Micromonospora sp. RL09-050-HVF-A]